MFALKHEPTGRYMPGRGDHRGSGRVREPLPRLFARAANAKQALAWWEAEQVGRRADDWAIVEVELAEVTSG